MRHALERQRVRDDAAAVDRRRHRAPARPRPRAAISSSIVLLARVRREPVALGRPAALAAEEQHRRVLAGAVVLEPRRLRAALEVVLGRTRLRQQARAPARADRADAGATRTRSRSRRRRGRVARGRRQRLDRLRRAAEEGHERRIAARLDDLAVGRRRRHGRGVAPRRASPRSTSTRISAHARSLRKRGLSRRPASG